jgi:acylphosphatase
VTPSEGGQQRQLYYRGVVQGVGFRYTARRIAARFRVTGYVRNLPDGRVLLVAEGLPEELERFLGEVRARMGQYIDGVEEAVGPAGGQFSHFEIRF